MINANSIGKASSGTGPHKADPLDEKKKAQLKKATQEFESIFVGYMLKTMRSTVPKSDMSDESFGADILDGMFDGEVAKHISHNGGLGIGEMLYKQITGSRFPVGSESDSTGLPLDGLGMSWDHPLKAKPLNLPPRVRLNGSAVSPDTVSQVGKFDDLIQEAADSHALDANLLKAVIATESGGKATAVSKKDARGLMQLIDSTANDMGVKDPMNPKDNVLGGAKYLKQLLDQFGGNLELALAAYNAGPGAVIEHQGVPPFKETKDYVNRVMDYLHVFESEAKDE